MNWLPPEWFYIYINDFILGEFKWTLIGALLTLWALVIAKFIGIITKKLWLQTILGIVLVILFVWFGHNLFDEQFHAIETWWITPLDEKMELVY